MRERGNTQQVNHDNERQGDIIEENFKKSNVTHFVHAKVSPDLFPRKSIRSMRLHAAAPRVC